MDMYTLHLPDYYKRVSLKLLLALSVGFTGKRGEENPAKYHSSC